MAPVMASSIEAGMRDPEKILHADAWTLGFSHPPGALMLLGILGQIPTSGQARMASIGARLGPAIS